MPKDTLKGLLGLQQDVFSRLMGGAVEGARGLASVVAPGVPQEQRDVALETLLKGAGSVFGGIQTAKDAALGWMPGYKPYEASQEVGIDPMSFVNPLAVATPVKMLSWMN